MNNPTCAKRTNAVEQTDGDCQTELSQPEYASKTAASSNNTCKRLDSVTQATLSRRNLKTEGSFSENASNVFRSNYTGDIRSLVIFRDILDLCLNNTRAGKNHDYRNRIVFEKFFFSCFLSTLKRKPGVLKFLGFEECF